MLASCFRTKLNLFCTFADVMLFNRCSKCKVPVLTPKPEQNWFLETSHKNITQKLKPKLNKRPLVADCSINQSLYKYVGHFHD